MTYWFSKLYESVDAMRLDDFAATLHPEVELVVGNNPPMHGREAAKGGVGYLFSTIAGLKHHFVRVIESEGTTCLELKVDYDRQDGRKVTIPVVTLLERRDDLVSSLRIYFDLAPVYAA